MKTRKNNIDHLRQMTFEWTLFRERVKILLTDHRIRVVGFPKVNTKYTEIQTKQKLDKKKKSLFWLLLWVKKTSSIQSTWYK